MDSDRIVKKLFLRAPLDRVWRALSDSKEFGDWFGMKFDGAFVPGVKVAGVVVGTKVDAKVAESQEAYKGASFYLIVERVEPQRLLSFRWHPFAVDPSVNYEDEPTTLVEFLLEERGDGVELTLSESGFDGIPISRRAQAFQANDGGWTMVMGLIEAHLAQNP